MPHKLYSEVHECVCVCVCMCSCMCMFVCICVYMCTCTCVFRADKWRTCNSCFPDILFDRVWSFPRLIFPGDQPRSRPKSAEALVLQGEKPVMEPKTPKKTELKKLSYKASGKVGAVKTTGKPKIRNYNVKDQ